MYPANTGVVGHGSGLRGKKGYGLAVGRKGKAYYGVLALALLGEMSCWDDIPPKRSKAELESLGACHKGEGERRHLDHSRKGCHGRQTNKIVFFCLTMGSGT